LDGYIVYNGEAKTSTVYFDSINFKCPSMTNPADYFMKILTVNYPKTPCDEEKIEYLVDKYENIIKP
jgi:hypothetical protein